MQAGLDFFVVTTSNMCTFCDAWLTLTKDIHDAYHLFGCLLFYVRIGTCRYMAQYDLTIKVTQTQCD